MCRRIVAITMGLIVLCCLSHAVALNAIIPLESIIASDYSISDITITGDELRFLAADQVDRPEVLVYSILDNTMIQEAIPSYGQLISNDSERFINFVTGNIQSVQENGTENQLCFDFDYLNGLSDEWAYSKPLLYNGKLYFILSYEKDGHTLSQLAVSSLFDLETSVFDTGYIREICIYKDNNLLALKWDDQNMSSVVVLDGATGKELETLPALTSYGAGGIAYDANADKVYVCQRNMLLRLENNAWTQVNYIPRSDLRYNLTAGILSDGRYAIVDDNELIIRDVDISNMPTLQKINVVGVGLPPNIEADFNRAYPNILVTIDNTLIDNANALLSTIISGDNAIDIYVLPEDVGVWALVKKGYFADLSRYEDLVQTVQRMHPDLQKTLFQNGSFNAVPVTLGIGAWTFREDLFFEAGYEALPKTLFEYFELLKEWETDKKGDFLFAFQNGYYAEYGLNKYACLSMAIDQYVLEYEKAGEPISFNTPIFRHVLAIICDIYPENEDFEQLKNKNVNSPNAIFQLENYNLLQLGVEEAKKGTLIPPFSFEANHTERAHGFVYLAGINPNSKNKDASALFLSFMLNHLNMDMNIALFPDQNEPIENNWVAEIIENLKKDNAYYQKTVKNLEEHERKSVEDAIIVNQQWIETYEAQRYIVTRRDIEKYRSIEKYMYIPTESLYWSLSSSDRAEMFGSLVKRYVAGTLDNDNLIHEMDRIMQRIYYEQ